MAHNAGCAALELEDLHTAHVWLTQLHSCKESREDAQAGEADLATRVSLWEGDHLALQRQAKLLHPHAHPFEQSIWWRRTAALGVRVLLLDSTLGDPQKPDHPARYQLCHPPVVEWEADERFHRALLVVDYRLACLRFSLGLSPAEDLFYRQLPFQEEDCTLGFPIRPSKSGLEGFMWRLVGLVVSPAGLMLPMAVNGGRTSSRVAKPV